MNQQLPPIEEQQLPYIYTEEEQRERWALIVQALLSALGSEVPKRHWMIKSSFARQPAPST